MPERLLEGQAEHVLDHDLVREADAERQPAAGRDVHRQRLLRQHDRMPRVGGDDPGAELDAGHLAPDDREDGQVVEAEDLRDPVAVEALVRDGLRVADRLVDAGRLSAEDSNAHGAQARPTAVPGVGLSRGSGRRSG